MPGLTKTKTRFSRAGHCDQRRLFSRRSHFTVFGTKVDGLAELAGEKNNGEIKNPCLLEKITIPAEAVPEIRFELELSGISEATIFPDLEALSRELEILLAHVVGFLIIENGLFLLGVGVKAEMPWVIELGAFLDLFVLVFLMGIAMNHLKSHFPEGAGEDLTTLHD